ncbi:MAG: glycosyltransferase family 1 protein [Cytophagales bacterium]|nr:MAG: glycosyltransferase family 1 protein [Cytophagales bacterium]
MPKPKRKIFFDERWIGAHGIGRVAKEINSSISPEPLKLPFSPVSILDPILFFIKTCFLPSNAIVFSPGYNAPLFKVRPFIFIVHDLNHFDRAENSSFLKKLYYQIILKRACLFADKILTVSEFSKNRIIQWSGVESKKVVNISNGVDTNFNLDGKVDKPNSTYLLCVSNRKPHKNEDRLIAAFSKADIDHNIHLFLTGESNEQKQTLITNLKIEHRVKFTGRVAEADLPNLYKGALALVFPSLYEGFGLPVIEAMACGTPVLTSNTSSLPEITNDAALLVNPDSELEIKAGIEKIANSEVYRNELINKGLLQAKKYSWEEVMKKINYVLNKI